MPAFSEHHGSKFVKLFFVGDSGAGKTGALVSLIQADYKLRIIDMDNGLDSLFQWTKKLAPEKLNNVNYETRRDKMKASAAGPIISGAPKACTDVLKLLDKWPDETLPREWGEDTILVLDSLTAFGKAAFEWAKGMAPSAKDPRQWYFAAQGLVEDTVSMMCGDDFHCNVIIISHINYSEDHDGMRRGYTSAIGSALGPKLPKYINTLLLAEQSGTGENIKRTIKTLPTSLFGGVKLPFPDSLGTLPLGTGLATVFQKLKAA